MIKMHYLAIGAVTLGLGFSSVVIAAPQLAQKHDCPNHCSANSFQLLAQADYTQPDDNSSDLNGNSNNPNNPNNNDNEDSQDYGQDQTEPDIDNSPVPTPVQPTPAPQTPPPQPAPAPLPGTTPNPNSGYNNENSHEN